MKANELRIGNLISEKIHAFNDNTKPFKIFSIYFEEGNEKVNGFSLSYFEPIPLTEEWLLKFGFKKDEFLFSKKRFHYDIENNLFYCGNDHVSSGNNDSKIVFVHELQNLYFALTGEELEINFHENKQL